MACPKAVLFQVKYTNRCPVALPGHGAGNCMTSDQGGACRMAASWGWVRAFDKGAPSLIGAWRGSDRLSVSGSDQAREGRLVDALAARGDEGRDTLR